MKKRIKHIIFAIIRLFVRPFYGRGIWLVTDRDDVADDNGEVFFEFLQGKPVKSVFAIKKSSPDYERVSKIGKVIEYESLRFSLLMCTCDVYISSQNDHMVDHTCVPQIFLQHGVSHCDLSKYVNSRLNKNTYVVVTTEFEKRTFEKPPYKIPKGHVMHTGMPRYDKLVNEPKGLILFAPTWRLWLRDADREEFEQSRFYSEFRKFVDDREFARKVSEKGYELVFKPHPKFNRFRESLKNENVRDYNGGTYWDFLKEGNILITDYSSTASDFAYLNKPVIYWQFDSDEFWKKHSVKKGEFDYETMGFGEVVSTVDELKDEIMKLIENNASMEKKYSDRVNAAFKYHDGSNSDRVYNRICNILNKWEKKENEKKDSYCL